MAILAFQKPDKVILLEADDHYGKFEFRPLEPRLRYNRWQCSQTNTPLITRGVCNNLD